MKMYRWFCLIIVVFVSLVGLLAMPQLGHALQQAHASPATTTLSQKTSNKLASKNSALPLSDYGLLGWPFSTAQASWKIAIGYYAAGTDHTGSQGYGFDFEPISGSAAGLEVIAPATGHAWWWDANHIIMPSRDAAWQSG